jgi:hypothetical protein
VCAGRIAAHAGPATNEIFFKPAFEGSILRSIWPLTRPNLAGAGTKFATPATKSAVVRKMAVYLPNLGTMESAKKSTRALAKDNTTYIMCCSEL